MTDITLSREQLVGILRANPMWPRKVRKSEWTTWRCGWRGCPFEMTVTGVKVADWPNELIDHIFRETHYEVKSHW